MNHSRRADMSLLSLVLTFMWSGLAFAVAPAKTQVRQSVPAIVPLVVTPIAADALKPAPLFHAQPALAVEAGPVAPILRPPSALSTPVKKLKKEPVPDKVGDGSDNDRSRDDGLVGGSGSFAALARMSGGTPDERPRREPGPDDTDGLDDNGNPRRDDNRGGPDDTWDGSDNDRSGNDGLF